MQSLNKRLQNQSLKNDRIMRLKSFEKHLFFNMIYSFGVYHIT